MTAMRPPASRTAARNEISEAAHAVLDHLDQNQERWADLVPWQDHISAAQKLANTAVVVAEDGHLPGIRDLAIEAAARLIDVIGELDRCIAAGER